ncbi:hypothetical protein A5625_05035 [Mycobacterium sp. 1465703.0]|nr:hypothetical protein A5625_05035 [Mycobacterium sp. 1465703.0]
MAASLELINECPVRMDLNGKNAWFVTKFEQGRHVGGPCRKLLGAVLRISQSTGSVCLSLPRVLLPLGIPVLKLATWRVPPAHAGLTQASGQRARKDD